MRIITTTAEDFVKSEIDEWGFDYVEAKFADGYEPTLVNGVWLWRRPIPVSRVTGLSRISGISRSARNIIVKIS